MRVVGAIATTAILSVLRLFLAIPFHTERYSTALHYCIALYGVTVSHKVSECINESWLPMLRSQRRASL